MNENPEKLIAQSPVPSQAEMEFRIDRVWERLSSENLKADPTSETGWHSNPAKRPLLRPVAVFACVLVAIAVAWFGVARRFVANRNVYALVESEDGSRYRIGAGQIVATDVWTRLAVMLPDGSRVEMRPQSQLSVSAASDGLRVRLDKGDIIVTAARQRTGHLYVDTKDVTVSVVGTVFLVGVEDAGSRVGVLEGKVQVKQGQSARMLVPPGQMVTNPVMELPSLREQVAWSRYAREYLALLPQDAAARVAQQTEKPVQTQPQAPLKPLQSNPSARATPRLHFEVASIKHNNSGSQMIRLGGGVGRYTATNAPLSLLIQNAYKVEDFQIIGAPAWIESERYDVEAKAEGTPSRDQMRGPMLQALIEDRFNAVVHGETRELPVYFLTVARNGSKVRSGPCLTKEANAPIPAGAPQSSFCGYMGMDNGRLESTGTPIQFLAESLSRVLRRKVLDRTGLAGNFDFNLRWTPDISTPGDKPTPSPDGGPSIFTALEEQLGLKLESGKAPIDVLVIDHIDHASEN